MDLVGPVLINWFMWMGEIRLHNGMSVHAYKHVETRRYLHLADGHTAFTYIEPDYYSRIRLDSALAEAFCDWDLVGSEKPSEDVAAYKDIRLKLTDARRIDV